MAASTCLLVMCARHTCSPRSFTSNVRLRYKHHKWWRLCARLCKVQVADVELYANLQKTQTQKGRSRRLMRLAVKNQSLSTTTAKTTPTWKLVCWRSASIVVDNSRIPKLSMDNKDIMMSDGW